MTTATAVVISENEIELLHRTANLKARSEADASANDARSWFSVENKKDDDADSEATIRIYDEIGMWGVSAKDFVQMLEDIDADSLNVHINSPGGAIFDGIAIYNALATHPARVIVTVDSLAASAASFIAMAGDEVRMMRNSQMMIHDGWGFAVGSAEDLRDLADLLDRLSNNIADIYAQKAGGTVQSWRAMMLAETWYSASEAVEAGLADKVVTPPRKTKEDSEAEDRWDLGVLFNYAGRSAAPSPRQVMESINTTKENSVPDAIGNSTGTASSGATVSINGPTPVAPDATYTASTATISVLINGVECTDLKAVQTHITALEEFRDESRRAARDKAVDDLVAEAKITAAQVAGFKSLVQTMSDEQFKMWAETWSAAPAHPLFGQHTSGGGGDEGGESARQDRIQVLEEIVASHRRAGRTQQEIEALDSYKSLMALKAQG